MSPPETDAEPKVAILLCTFNGEQYLAAQLDSFAAQTHKNWEVWTSDDGSQDGTRTILETYKHQWKHNHLSIHTGPAQGFVANFLSLTQMRSINADYFAYSDQDDLWEVDKISRAIASLAVVPPGTPAMYCSRTRYISADGDDLGCSTLFTRPATFKNALVQSIAGANTIVLNRAARELVATASHHFDVASHDWWAYMLITGCGGHVFYDSYPGVRYRQHGRNMAGQNVSLSASVVRANELLAGRFKRWNEMNLSALHGVRDLFTEENRAVLDAFSNARERSFLSGALEVYRAGVYRQTTFGNIGLFVAVLFNRL